MIRFLFRLLLGFLYHVRVEGSFSTASRTLIIANHQSFLDALLFYAYLPVDPVWVVHQQVADQMLFRWLLRQVDHLIIEATNPFALKSVVGVIESGRPVVIFPEGRITVTGSLMKVYEGTGFLAARTSATVIPINIDGAIHARGFSRMKPPFPLRWFPSIRITILPQTCVPMPEGRSGKERRRKAGDSLRRILQQSWFDSRPNLSVHDTFLHAVEFYGRSRVMVEDATGAALTYGGLLKGSLALGRLVSKITNEGDCVGVMLPNAAASCALFFGLIGVRRLPAMLNFTAGAEGLQSAIHAAKISVVLTSKAFVERGKLQPLIERLEGVKVVFLEDLRASLTVGDKLWLILYALRAPHLATLRSRPNEPGAVLFTSGSEDKPKGVVLSNQAVLANINQCLAIIDVSCMDKFFSAMPIFHSFGLMAGMLMPVLNGMPVFFYPTPLHSSIIPELIYDRDCNVLFATPTFLKNYAKRANAYDFRRVRFLLAGAEKLTQDIRDLYVERFGIRILEGYGATECSPVIAVNTPFKAKSGSVGELLPRMECKLEPVEGVEEGGLLHVRGPNLMMGYWKDAHPRQLEWPESIYGNDWYPTGDLAKVDEDGFLVLLGRLKRFAKVAGEMVSLEVVERIAETASPKAPHGSVVLKDPSRGEMIVLSTQDANLKRDQLQQAARKIGAPELAIPRRIVYIEKIPLLGNGKKDYPTLTKMVEEKLERPAQTEPA